MHIDQFEVIIDRYLAGQASPEEKAFITTWLHTRPADAEPLAAERQQALQHTLWRSVALQTVDKPTTGKPGLLRQLVQRRTWLPYAAAVAVLVTGSIVVYHGMVKKAAPTYQLISALPGKAKTIQLPDSSTVHLFPGATVAVPDNFNREERMLKATGRVFFEVKHDTAKPFYVQSGELRTRVLGTSFEVYASDSLHQSVIVRTGRVGVQYGQQRLAQLTPGKRLRFDAQQNKLLIDQVNAGMLCEWWNNGMVFHQAPLYEVMQTLTNWYNVPIRMTNTKWMTEPVTIRIKDQDLSAALTLLSQTLGFHYKKENGQVLIY
ncbi:FecR family protein [Paraflavitalea pollutisoli]|uniref:FecR family protein n=1 Tax=Paraflavitalea pollutisoli TaxID=3034143 RepID=UPI0023EBF44F|nr:FecR domain-containing protein [Paraflavitalea sp. H1-2-19X]